MFTALFLPQKRLMSSMASQNTRCKHAPVKRIGHGLDTSCGFMRPRRRVFITNSRMKKKCSNTNSRMKKEVLKSIKQIKFCNVLSAKFIVVVGGKIGRFWCFSGWELTKTTETRTLCTCCRFLLFLTGAWHKQMSLSTQPLWKNFPQDHCAWRPSSLSIASRSSSVSRSISVMVSLTSMAEASA